MMADAIPSQRGVRLVALTPSRLEQSLGEALRAAASISGISLVYSSALGGGAPAMEGGTPAMEDDALMVCADVGGLETQATLRMAAVLSEPERASRWIAQSHGCTDWHGLVFASRSFAHALDAARQRQAPVFRDIDFRADPEATLWRLLRFLDIDPGAGSFDSHVRAFGEAVRGLVRDDALAGAGESIFDRALSIYGTPIPGVTPSAWWDRGLFRWGDCREETCPPVIDVTGLPRCIVFGPYVSLPAGAWRADVEFELCEQAARRSYFLDFGSDQGFSQVAVGPLQAGRNVVSVEHHFEAAAAAWVRVVVARAAFHGEMRFHGATITCLDPAPVWSVCQAPAPSTIACPTD